MKIIAFTAFKNNRDIYAVEVLPNRMKSAENREPVRKRIFKVLFISVFSSMLGLGIIAPLIPIYASNLGATGIWLGLIFSGFALSRAIFMPLIGKLSDVKGRKRFITAGLLIYSLISLVYLAAYDVYTLTIIRLVHGFASAMVVPIAMAYVGETTEKGREGEAMGTFTIALFLGIGMGPFLGGVLSDSFGIASVFYAMTGLTAIALVITISFLPDIKFPQGAGGKGSAPFREILKNDIVRGLIFFRAGNAMGRGGLMAFLPIFAASLGIGASQVGILLSVIFLCALLQRPFGKLADRYNKFYLVLVGAASGAFAILLIPFAHNFWALLAVCFAIGIAGAVAIPAATAMVVLIGEKVGMGTSMGIFNTAMSVGIVIGPLTLGLVMDNFGVGNIFYFASLLNFIGVIGFLLFSRRGLRLHEEFTQ